MSESTENLDNGRVYRKDLRLRKINREESPMLWGLLLIVQGRFRLVDLKAGAQQEVAAGE